jgi:hypothetical protein
MFNVACAGDRRSQDRMPAAVKESVRPNPDRRPPPDERDVPPASTTAGAHSRWGRWSGRRTVGSRPLLAACSPTHTRGERGINRPPERVIGSVTAGVRERVTEGDQRPSGSTACSSKKSPVRWSSIATEAWFVSRPTLLFGDGRLFAWCYLAPAGRRLAPASVRDAGRDRHFFLSCDVSRYRIGNDFYVFGGPFPVRTPLCRARCRAGLYRPGARAEQGSQLTARALD